MRAMPLRRLLVVAILLAPLVGHVGHGGAVVPGENGKIAFASTRNGNREIYVVNADTTGLARLTNDPSVDTDPAWSSDGKRIAFTSTRTGGDEIYLMNEDGTGQTQLTSAPGSDSNATWSPLGRNIAFASTRDGDADIYVMNEDGTGQTPLTSNGVADANPSWSPDAASIAFRSERDGNSEIYAMKVDGTEIVRLTFNAALDVSPAWSPDGKSIAWASLRDGNYEIYVMNSDGSDPRRLTRNLDVDLDPAWSPNGKFIAFTSNRDGNNEIYVMNADGSNQTRLTTEANEDTTPDWQWQRMIPAPPKPVEDADFVAVRWKESVFRGSLLVVGRVPGLSKMQLALRQGKRIVVADGLTVTKGAFSKRLALPRDLTPGAFTLEVGAAGSPTQLTAQRVRLHLAPPPEGVVSESWASSTVEGPPLERIPSTSTSLWAHFEFAALPQPGRRLSTTWYIDGRRRSETTPKNRRSPVIGWLRLPPDLASFPRGTYSCVLKAGSTVTKRVTFRVR